ncbi:HET-domain-containing protein [Biscogniauxia sp. FL1348]|nr:HET-domain-containing protein [Biscogniauxia sp. FL1348]
MRLINVHTHELREFFSAAAAPPYAILSHTWTSEEMTLQSWEATPRRPGLAHAHQHKPGYRKILSACAQTRAAQDQDTKTDWLWCDTNCIDKRSSAELSEAINSMFAWYRDAAVCYAYLDDVDAGSPEGFARSRWFTRGWTLQELLAPSKVLFFDRNWKFMGDRARLSRTISKVTRIHIGVLNDRTTIYDYSVAQRMSWAADRHTTREEDIAYCLLGIFDINMPLLYGEGLKAFQRLQHEIIKISNDQSILAWDMNRHGCTGALAPSPLFFRSCGSIVRDLDTGRSPYSMTNIGLSVDLPVIQTLLFGIILVGLNCSFELRQELNKNQQKINTYNQRRRRFQVWIWLRGFGENGYERAHFSTSKTSFEHSYPNMVHGNIKKITVITTFPSMGLFDSFSHIESHSTGIYVMVGFGKFTPRFRLYEEAFLPGKLNVVHLKLQTRSALSHQIISCGSFSTILSVSWDEYERPEKIGQTTFFDPDMRLIHSMSTQEDWSCLFGTRQRKGSTKGADNATQLQVLHQRLEKLPKRMAGVGEEDRAPLILIESGNMEDHQGRRAVLVEIVFREALSHVSERDVCHLLKT